MSSPTATTTTASHSSSSLNPHGADEERLIRMYGRLPSRASLLNKKLQDRKYFDSGDYALSQAGKNPSSNVGSALPFSDNEPNRSVPTSMLRRGSNSSTSPQNSPPQFNQQMFASCPGNNSPPKTVGSPQAYNNTTSHTNTPGTVPILSPVRDRSSSLSPPDADIANMAVNSYHQRLAERLK